MASGDLGAQVGPWTVEGPISLTQPNPSLNSNLDPTPTP